MKIQAQKIDTLAGHKDCVYALEAHIEHNSFFSSGADGLVALWNLENPEIGKLVAQVPNSVYALKLLEEEKQLLIGQNTQGIHLVDLGKMQEIKSLQTTHTSIFDIAYYNQEIFVAYADGDIHIIDKNLWRIRKVLSFSKKPARCMAINAFWGHLAVGYSDWHIRIFDIKTFELIVDIDAHANSVFTLAYSPDAQFLLSAGRDAQIKIWEINKHYHLQKSIPAHLYTINHLSFSPKGEFLASCSMDKSIKIWDSQTFELLKVLDKSKGAGHGTSVNKLFWSKYNNQLLSASDDRSIGVWEVAKI
ncbi:MAG: WD40 repeat domain-containing protein [Thermonemataceae bacterium]|nr:WD40 repeat domain-containing protein [Thermonemataceae bacterium]